MCSAGNTTIVFGTFIALKKDGGMHYNEVPIFLASVSEDFGMAIQTCPTVKEPSIIGLNWSKSLGWDAFATAIGDFATKYSWRIVLGCMEYCHFMIFLLCAVSVLEFWSCTCRHFRFILHVLICKIAKFMKLPLG